MKNVDLNDPNLKLESLSDGSIISQRVLDLIEVIEETWNGRVAVNWIPSRALKPDEMQFVLLEVLPDGREEPIFWVKNEDEFTGEVLERLFVADNSKGNVLTRMQARNAALQALTKKKNRDEMDEKNDIALSVLKSPLNRYRLSKDKSIRDYGNRVI